MSDSMSLRLEFYGSFIAVCEEKSFSKAAKRVGLSQGAISQQVAALERNYGVRLLERGGEVIKPTAVGELVLKRAYEMLAVEKRLRQDVERISGSADNTILIAASTIPGEHLLPTILREFRSIHPDVSFKVNITDSKEAWRQLKENRVDFAAVGTLIEDLQAYELAELATEELVLIVPIESTLASKSEASVRDALKPPFISREAGSGTRREVENMLRKKGISWNDLNIVSELGSTEAVVTAVQQGMGVSIVSSIAARVAAETNLVKIIKLKDLETTRKLLLVRRRVDTSKRQAARVLTEEFWRFTISRRSVHYSTPASDRKEQ